MANPIRQTASAIGMIGCLLMGLPCAPGLQSAEEATPSYAQVTTAFGAECEALILTALGSAREEVSVAVYTFTRHRIAQALMQAKKRGVDVRVKVDAESARWEGMADLLKTLKRHGVPVELIVMPRKGTHMHHKFIVIDGRTVLTGSYNFTTQATDENRENLVQIISPATARAFKAEFEAIASGAAK